MKTASTCRRRMGGPGRATGDPQPLLHAQYERRALHHNKLKRITWLLQEPIRSPEWVGHTNPLRDQNPLEPKRRPRQPRFDGQVMKLRSRRNFSNSMAVGRSSSPARATLLISATWFLITSLHRNLPDHGSGSRPWRARCATCSRSAGSGRNNITFGETPSVFTICRWST